MQRDALGNEFATDIDVANMSLHGEGGDEATFNELLRIIAHDLAVLAGAGLGFVGIDHEVMRATTGILGHEGPFETCGEASAATTAKA